MGDPERWEILFYRDDEGSEPVREWLEELEKKKPADYGRVRHHIDLIGIRRPAIGTVQQAVEREVERAASREWRVTYFADPTRRLILLTSFRKTTRKTRPKEIARAEKLMKDWLRRMEGRR